MKQPKNPKTKIIEIITGNTEYWQPYGEKNSCFIIEKADPFFWRINPKWAEEVSDKIIKEIDSQ